MEENKYKKLIRLYVPEDGFVTDKKCSLSEGQAHYLRNVMRKSAGDVLRVFNGHDGEWLADLVEISKNKAFIKLTHQILQQKKGTDVWVLASPVKKEAFDLMIEKACELGASKFIPVTCDHTVVHKINQERLQAIAIEAAEQSERHDVMSVEPLVSLKEFLNSYHYDRNLIFCIERQGVPSLASVLRELKQTSKPLAILIGPEGGFSYQEVDSIQKFDYIKPVSLGARILKAETAVIATLAAIQLLD